MVPRPRHHYLQASVIGGFGRQDSSELRRAAVAVRRKGAAAVGEATAESLAHERGPVDPR